MTGALLFEKFSPGTVLGDYSMVLDRELFENWFKLFPEDRDGDLMPVGMVAPVMMRAYASILRGKPAGNLHGGQKFSMIGLPRIGDCVTTEFRCVSKEFKRERRWLGLASETRTESGALLWSALMKTVWAA